MSKLTSQEISKALRELQGWQLVEKRIEKDFTFDTYMSGINFVERIAEKAEEHNHHLDLEVGWCRVKVIFTSHDTGGISNRDIRMAHVVENLL